MSTKQKMIMIRNFKINPIITNNNNQSRKVIGLIEFIDPSISLACYFGSDNRRCDLYECILKDNKVYYTNNILGNIFYGDLNATSISLYNRRCKDRRYLIKYVYLINSTISINIK